jgi:uncharacterized DUF497 family protein
MAQIEFDPDKDQLNRAKHGISLAAAAEIDLDGATSLKIAGSIMARRAFSHMDQ